MERKRSTSSEEDGCDSKKSRRKFTEIETTLKDTAANKYFDEPLGDSYQPQFCNYQLIGDLVAIGILNSKDLIMKPEYYAPVEPIQCQRFCNVAWSVQDLLLEMKSKKSCYPIAKKVILAVGYNDYRSNSMSADMFVECLEKAVQKLRRRGCAEIILTNVPPCGMECDSINHWKYLQIINDEILKLCQKHDYIEHCDIFKLFCRPKNLFSPNKDYVSYSEINYKVDFTMYNEVGLDDEIDLISFSSLAKIVLGKHMAKTVEKRVEFLQRGQVDKVICVLKEASDDSDSEDDAVVIVKAHADKYGGIINLDLDEDDAGANRKDGDTRKETDGPAEHEISTSIKPNGINKSPVCEKPLESERIQPNIPCSIEDGDIRKENTSGEVPPEGEQMQPSPGIKSVGDVKKENTSSVASAEGERKKQVIPSSVEGAGDIKRENPSSKVSPGGDRTKQVIPPSIEGAGDFQKESTSSEVSAEGERMQHGIPCSIEEVGDIKKEKTSGKVFAEGERMQQIISCSIERVGVITQKKTSGGVKEGNTSGEVPPEKEKTKPVSLDSVRSVVVMQNEKIPCDIPQSNEIKQESNSDVESERIKREIVRNIDVRVNPDAVDRMERSEPNGAEMFCDIRKSEPVKQEVASNIQNSEPAKQVIVGNLKKSDGTGDEKHSPEMPKDGRPRQVIFCNFKNVVSDSRASCETPQEDGQLKWSSSKTSDNVEDKKPSSKKEDLPAEKVIFCSMRRFNVEEDKPS